MRQYEAQAEKLGLLTLPASVCGWQPSTLDDRPRASLAGPPQRRIFSSTRRGFERYDLPQVRGALIKAREEAQRRHHDTWYEICSSAFSPKRMRCDGVLDNLGVNRCSAAAVEQRITWQRVGEDISDLPSTPRAVSVLDQQSPLLTIWRWVRGNAALATRPHKGASRDRGAGADRRGLTEPRLRGKSSGYFRRGRAAIWMT